MKFNCLKNFFTYKNTYFLLYFLIFVAGCYFRLEQYFLLDDMHYDEIAIAMQTIERSYCKLFAPLDMLQVCPPLFLVITKFLYSILFNLHPTINFRDLIFRLLPLCSGIISIPLFGYLLNKLFKNPFITCLGMLILAINPAHIVWSVTFKQYAFELLILLFIITLFLKVNIENKDIVRNILIFILLGLTFFCSMTALFVVPVGFLYLIFKIKDKKLYKQLVIPFIVFTLIFIVYFFIHIFPVYIMHYGGMNSFWFQGGNQETHNLYNYINLIIHILFRTVKFSLILSILFFISSLIMLFKNIKLFSFAVLPIIITYIFSCLHSYPIAEKFLLFLLPCVIICFIYPISLLNSKFKFYDIISILLILTAFIVSIKFIQPKEFRNSGLLNTKTILTYLNSNYSNDGKIIYYPDTNQLYNANIYYKNLEPSIKQDKIDVSRNLPKGIYYIICANYTVKDGVILTENFLDRFLKDCEILEYKTFKGRNIYSHRPSLNGNFEKIIDDAIYIKVNKIN